VRIGIGLPTTVKGASPNLLVPWVRRAAEGPFASLAAHDRLAYDSLEPMAALAAAAAVTERMRLASLVVIGPLRSPALLAKQAATLNALAGGRLALAVTVVLAGRDYPERGDVGTPIEGIAEAEAAGALVFHAGTAVRDGHLVTNGGRILNVTALGDSVAAARAAAYDAASHIDFAGVKFRRDIAHA